MGRVDACPMIGTNRSNALLPDFLDGRFIDIAHDVSAGEILLAGDDRAVAADDEPRPQPRAWPAPGRGHVGDGDVGDLAGAVTGTDDDGRAEGAQPLVVP